MKITESRLRQIIIEELMKRRNVRQLNEQPDEEQPQKPDPTPEEIVRIMKALEPILKKADKSKVTLALKHVSSPSPLDDSSKDEQELGKLFIDIIYSDNPDSVMPLFRQLKKMATDDEKQKKQEEDLEKKKKEEEGT